MMWWLHPVCSRLVTIFFLCLYTQRLFRGLAWRRMLWRMGLGIVIMRGVGALDLYINC